MRSIVVAVFAALAMICSIHPATAVPAQAEPGDFFFKSATCANGSPHGLGLLAANGTYWLEVRPEPGVVHHLTSPASLLEGDILNLTGPWQPSGTTSEEIFVVSATDGSPLVVAHGVSKRPSEQQCKDWHVPVTDPPAGSF